MLTKSFVYFLLILLLSSVCYQVNFASSSSSSSPKLEEFKPKRFQNIGNKFVLVCIPLEGLKPFHFEWYKNGILIQQQASSSNAATYRITETPEGESLLVIEKLSSSDSANYSCSVSNHFGTDSQLTQLIVRGLIL